jgi:SAM-dependent methyltransferase
VLSRRVCHRVGTWYGELLIGRLPDRIYLERELIPAAARHCGKVLFIGCRHYTKHYPALFRLHGAECWTIDIDPTMARWGAPERHVSGDILDALDYWPASTFDTIVLNGVFGFGLNGVRDQDAALQVCRVLLKTGGRLILGWNSDRCGDPSGLPTLRSYFWLSSFPTLTQRQTFAKSTHVFDTFTLGQFIGLIVPLASIQVQ